LAEKLFDVTVKICVSMYLDRSQLESINFLLLVVARIISITGEIPPVSLSVREANVMPLLLVERSDRRI
jgi:hypothetical protein